MSRTADKIPPWVKSGALAYHKSKVLFFIGHVQRSPNQQIYLCDFDRIALRRDAQRQADRGLTGAKYRLEECEPGTAQHFKSVALMTCNGTPISVERDRPNRLVFTQEGRPPVAVQIDPAILELPEFDRAVQSFARAFSGAIASEVS